jgi:hypothetical protein
VNGLGAALLADGPHASLGEQAHVFDRLVGAWDCHLAAAYPVAAAELAGAVPLVVAGIYGRPGGTRCARRGQRGRCGGLVSRVATVRGRAHSELSGGS